MVLPSREPLSWIRFLTIVLGCVAAHSACGGGTGTTPTAPTATAAMPATPIVNPAGLHFTASPMDINAIQTITALGAMAPWGHTLPTDHVYFVHHEGSSGSYAPEPVYAPGPGTVEFTSNGRVDVIYDAVFRYWIGPLTLADGIRPGARVEAGTLLGHHSIFPAFDFAVLRSTLQLGFVNPLRYGRDTLTSDGPMQYFDEPIRSALHAKVRRSGDDKDGRLNFDVAGTLAGNWFAEDLPVSESGRGGEMYYGVRKLSFARDVFSPDRPRVSIGGLGFTGLYGVQAGAPEFADVTPASGLVVFRLMSAGAPLSAPSTIQLGWLLVQLLDAERLRIEAVAFSTAPAPSAFSAKAETYLR